MRTQPGKRSLPGARPESVRSLSYGAMRIALVHMRHARSGGTEGYLDALAAHLVRAGHAVSVVCRSHVEPPDPRVRFEVLRGVHIGGGWRMWGFARAVERHVARAGYDVVLGLGKTWTHDVVRLGGGCQRTYLELAHAWTLSGTERLLGAGALKQRLAVSIEERALAPGAFARVVTNSRMVRRDVQERYAIPDDALETIENGVDLERFHPRNRSGPGADLREQLGFRPDECVVLFLGTGYARKGLDLVLEAFPRFAREHPEARLVVAGYDSARARYEARASELGLAERVRFLGGRSDPENCYAAADLYVLPTRYDPFANSTLEALASGTPVITSTTNGAGELIEPGVQGTLVEVAQGPEALAAALQDWGERSRRERAGLEARRLAEGHALETKLARMAAVLAAVSRPGALAGRGR